MTNRDAALQYARGNVPVHPLHSTDEQGACSCGDATCANAGKHPRTVSGFLDATTDRDRIESWWKRWATANIGIPTGEPSGLYVLDVDSKTSEGRRLVTELSRDAALMLEARLVATPGKAPDYVPGLHIWIWSAAKQRTISLGIGELKGTGGYVVAPPSIRAGRAYRFLSRGRLTVPDPHEWARQLLQAFDVVVPEPAPGPDLGMGWAATWLRTPLPSGTRRAPDGIPRMVGYLRGHGVDRETAIAILELWDARNPEPLGSDEVRAHVTGMYERYGIPPRGGITFPETSAGVSHNTMTVSVG